MILKMSGGGDPQHFVVTVEKMEENSEAGRRAEAGKASALRRNTCAFVDPPAPASVPAFVEVDICEPL